MPVEVRPANVPPRRTAFAERPLDVVDGRVRGCFGLAVICLLGDAYRPPGRHQPADEIGPLGLFEIGIRHAPKPAADDEAAAVRRHRMLHDTLSSGLLNARDLCLIASFSRYTTPFGTELLMNSATKARPISSCSIEPKRPGIRRPNQATYRGV